MILTLVDFPVTYVKADAEFDDVGVNHIASVLIGFENGARASFNAGMNFGTDTSDRYDRLFIHGSKGYIRSDVEYNAQGELSFDVTVKNEKGERITHTESVCVGSNYSLELEHLTPPFSHKSQTTLLRQNNPLHNNGHVNPAFDIAIIYIAL